MKTIAEKQAEARAAQDHRRAQDEADMKAIAKLFDSPEGQLVLELLMRRFGVLGMRFQTGDRGEVNAIRAGIKDGNAEVILFIIQCLKKAGKDTITFPI